MSNLILFITIQKASKKYLRSTLSAIDAHHGVLCSTTPSSFEVLIRSSERVHTTVLAVVCSSYFEALLLLSQDVLLIQY